MPFISRLQQSLLWTIAWMSTVRYESCSLAGEVWSNEQHERDAGSPDWAKCSRRANATLFETQIFGQSRWTNLVFLRTRSESEITFSTQLQEKVPSVIEATTADTDSKFCDQHIGNTSEDGDEIEGIPFITEIILKISRSNLATTIDGIASLTRKPKAMIFMMLSTVKSAVKVVLA